MRRVDPLPGTAPSPDLSRIHALIAITGSIEGVSRRSGPQPEADQNADFPANVRRSPVGPAPARRDFLFVATAAVAGVGVGATLWPLIDQMNPDAATQAAAAPLDVDVDQIPPGQQIVALWAGRPVFIVHRTQAALDTLRDPALVARLSDPNSTQLQQPPYAVNWHRSINPDFLVLLGICTHLGCVPTYTPKPDASDPAPNWPGGYFCHCHGSKYDLAGRVFLGVPAPYNLPVPPHRFPDGKTLRIGENPAGSNFDFNSILQA
jgi:ubiquinol-cytochrome c reductase iron-sulfur subunit